MLIDEVYHFLKYPLIYCYGKNNFKLLEDLILDFIKNLSQTGVCSELESIISLESYNKTELPNMIFLLFKLLDQRNTRKNDIHFPFNVSKSNVSFKLCIFYTSS